MKRLFLPGAHSGAMAVSGPAFHYLVRVQRLEAGATLEVFDGEGKSFPARLVAVTAEAATLELDAGRAESELTPIAIVQGLPKGDKLELVLQKGTELGATAFVPFAAERSVVKLGDKADARQKRWQKVVEEAARQCGRADVPKVEAARPLLEALQRLPKDTRLFVLDEEERAVRLSHAAAQGEGPVALVIGPEGGLTRGEVASLEARGAKTVTLGRRVLRTETAALAALAVLRHLEGELG
jgi:16S rRNA (uracil1498-N3)-methyltransferase